MADQNEVKLSGLTSGPAAREHSACLVRATQVLRMQGPKRVPCESAMYALTCLDGEVPKSFPREILLSRVTRLALQAKRGLERCIGKSGTGRYDGLIYAGMKSGSDRLSRLTGKLIGSTWVTVYPSEAAIYRAGD